MHSTEPMKGRAFVSRPAQPGLATCDIRHQLGRWHISHLLLTFHLTRQLLGHPTFSLFLLVACTFAYGSITSLYMRFCSPSHSWKGLFWPRQQACMLPSAKLSRNCTQPCCVKTWRAVGAGEERCLARTPSIPGCQSDRAECTPQQQIPLHCSKHPPQSAAPGENQNSIATNVCHLVQVWCKFGTTYHPPCQESCSPLPWEHTWADSRGPLQSCLSALKSIEMCFSSQLANVLSHISPFLVLVS